MSARFASMLVALGALASCSAERTYDNNDLELTTAYRAREFCSCAFVMEQDDEFCIRWTRSSPDVAKVMVDRQKKTVEASALLMWGAKAHYVDDRAGCVLE